MGPKIEPVARLYTLVMMYKIQHQLVNFDRYLYLRPGDSRTRGQHRFFRERSNYDTLRNSWAEIYRGRLFLGSNLVSFNRTLVPDEISKVNFRTEKIFLSVCQKRFNKLKNINTSETSKMTITHGSGFQWYRTYERGYEI